MKFTPKEQMLYMACMQARLDDYYESRARDKAREAQPHDSPTAPQPRPAEPTAPQPRRRGRRRSHAAESLGQRYSRIDKYGVYSADGTRIGRISCGCEDYPCCGH